MPIYEYRCDSCGHQQEFLQRMSDTPLKKCPECGKATFKKLLSAAGFQLKGTGWYVTDFRDNKSKTAMSPAKADKPAAQSADSAKSGEGAAKESSKPAPVSAAPSSTSSGETKTKSKTKT